MANKISDGVWIAGAIIVAVLLIGKQPATPGTPGTTTTGGVDLCKLVSTSAQFTAQRLYQTSTAVLPANTATGMVRVISSDGVAKLDLGNVSLNTGTLTTQPSKTYMLYYGLDTARTAKVAGTDYYVTKDTYNAPCQEGRDAKAEAMCLVGTPTLTVFDEYGNVQSSGTNAQAMTNNDKKDVTIRVRAPSRQCIGSPDAAAEGKSNALCLSYNVSSFKTVTSTEPISEIPYSISTNYSKSGYAIACFKVPVLADTAFKDVVISLEAQNVELSQGDNMTVLFKDPDMDLDAQTFSEIWGFADEENHPVGGPVINTTQVLIS